jgi:hypothetical protein
MRWAKGRCDDVEFISAAPDLPQHRQCAADMIPDAGQSKTLSCAGN